MRVLVTFGSKRGGTEELASWLATALMGEGFVVDVVAPGQVGDLDQYDAVVIGGALCAGRWHKDARRFVRRRARQLATKPTYFFSSGPLDDSAGAKEIPPVGMVHKLMARVGARGHATFGGRLMVETDGPLARAMAKKMSGDWRNLDQVDRWAAHIAADLRTAEETHQPA